MIDLRTSKIEIVVFVGPPMDALGEARGLPYSAVVVLGHRASLEDVSSI